jgi:L-ascorbate oxidase
MCPGVKLPAGALQDLGSGPGVCGYPAAINSSALNLANPATRDTGCSVLRFVADNPGLWPFHCHILWHLLMGQQLYFVVEPSQWPVAPMKLPRCPAKCVSAVPLNTSIPLNMERLRG